MAHCSTHQRSCLCTAALLLDTVICTVPLQGTGLEFLRYAALLSMHLLRVSTRCEHCHLTASLAPALISILHMPCLTCKCPCRSLQNVIALTGAAGFGVSLFLIHIYMTPIKRFLQLLWAAGVIGGTTLMATQVRSSAAVILFYLRWAFASFQKEAISTMCEQMSSAIPLLQVVFCSHQKPGTRK